MSLAASAGRGPGAVWSPTHVQVTVLQARGLRAKGPGGTSDAYAVIQVGKEKYATSVSERSLGAPVWREEATFELPPLLSTGAAPAAAATLQLTVLHRALLGLDKFLGRAEVDLRELHRDQSRRKTQWYTLKSKPGKKDKERGEIEVDIQFMRNNMTASMFDLSMKDKSRNPFGKLKDKIKGKNKETASDTASAIVSSMSPSADSDDESSLKDKKKKSKIKNLFSKSNLQKTPLSQSMSVLPTSKSDKVLLHPGEFQSRWENDDNEDESSSASDVMSHKRTASVDPKQLNQINFNLPKKEGLSFLGGLRSKNDSLSRSNVCINGNHVYMEEPEAKSETKDSTPSPSPSPQGFRKKHLFSSTENLATRSWKEPGEGGAVSSDRGLSESATKDSLKYMSLPSYRPLVSGDNRENLAPATLEAAKETKESKKQENKKSSLLSLVTGKKDVAKGSEGESPPTIPRKEREKEKEKEGTLREVRPGEGGSGPAEDLVKRSEKNTTAVVSGRGKSLNPFEEVQITEPEADPEPKSEPAPPVTSARAPQTKAVKPRLEVSPEAQPTARLPSSSESPLFFSALPFTSGQTPVPSELGHDSETQSSESPSVFSSFSSPIAAPISTSTPIKNWPSTDQGQAASEAPPLLLEEESLTQVPNTVSCALGSLAKQPPIPVCEGMEDSPMGKTSEIGTEKNSSGNDSEKSLLKQPEMGQQELLRVPATKQQGHIPSSEEAPEVTIALSLRSGRIERPAGKPPMGENTDLESPSRSFVESEGRDGGMSVIEEAAPPLQVGESVPPLDSVMRRPEEMGLNVSEGRKKIKKRVSFSEQLCTEEEVEKSTGLVEDDRETAKVATLEVGASSLSGLPARPEKEKALSGEVDGLAAPAESACDLRTKAPKASVTASSEQTTALGIHKPYLGKSSHLDKQLPGTGSGEEEKLMGNGRPGQPPDAALESLISGPSFSETFPATHSFSSSPHSDTHHTSTAESQKKATAEGSAGKVENSGKRKPLLQAWVSPSETHPVSPQPSAGTGSAKHRLHPVKPMNTTATRIANSSLGTATIISENLINEAMMKKYNPSDPAFAYAQLTHDELIQLVLKQKETISKKEFQVRELEDYIDNLLVRVMEETPNILRVPAQVGKKAGKM
ncbi:PREDICTED: rab11 family-interacting protein 1 isoform X2 [Ceratotherium simum simum]|uniref:Rab11 family-interacting protein 1 isoform X2 n=1 Tax=Ceratotherium simum simum TaxID=73337 RepID=A0ABM1CQI7_CERSS|nr:PREDICTED: rab11 family-interacting protein 1 isoform X2 [Ceratotherium simum simum]